jgi:hypothetical protein
MNKKITLLAGLIFALLLTSMTAQAQTQVGTFQNSKPR